MADPKTDAVIPLFLKVVNRYIATEKRPCDYGVGCVLYRSEIHTIDAIGKHGALNVTSLAAALGVTKSAASQMIDKLVKKELVVKTPLSKSDTEVALTLTPKGETVYNGHSEYHRAFFSKVERLLSTVSERDIAVFVEIMNQLDEVLREER